MESDITDKMTAIVGKEGVTSDSTELSEYSGNPSWVVRPTNSEQVRQIVKLANERGMFLVPVSSGLPRLRGCTMTKSKDSVVVDLRRMNKILRIDSKNRVAMVEPGVKFGELLPELEKHGLRPLMPLLPKASQSVVISALDQEPITTPRFHWDTPDPLLCTEVVFGNGDLFRTGSSAGPGTLDEQWESGQAQKNPMGPSQFDPYRILQGSQGTMGIVTWASLKCETKPKDEQVFLVGVEKLEDLHEFAYTMLRRKLADHLFILNGLNMSNALKTSASEISDLARGLPEWILVLSFSGKGLLADEELEYRIADARDISKDFELTLSDTLGNVSAEEVRGILENPSADPYWKLRFIGACREVFFLTTLDMTTDLYSNFLESARSTRFPEENIGVYIQPTVQGTNTHCFFDIYYDPDDSDSEEKAHKLFHIGSQALMQKGAYFSRPTPEFADSVYSLSASETLAAMKHVKDIFDPNHVLSPGNLCFREVGK